MVEYVGFDVSKEATAFLRDGCGREGFGARAKVASDPKAPFEVLREPCLCPERIVLETGTLSFWLARGLGKRGLPVDVIDARPGRTRQMKLQHNKTASGRRLELLAEIACTGFCRAVAVKSAAAQEVRILPQARAHLVRQRRATENAIRGLLGSLGLRFPKAAGKLAGRVRTALEARPELKATFEPLLSCVEALKREIARLDERVVARAKATPACRLLMSVPGARAGDRAGFCRDPRRPEPVRQTAHGRGLSGADDAGAFSPEKWTPRGAYPSTATPWCAACSTRPPTPCSRVVRKAHPLKADPLKAHPLKDWARPGSGDAAATRRPAWRWRKLAVILQRMLTTGAPFRWPEKKDAARAQTNE